MRTCKICRQEYKKEDFPVAKRTDNKTYYRYLCKSCYQTSKVNYKNKQRCKLIKLKQNLSCYRCGISDYRVLEFHHSNSDKSFNIADAIRQMSFKKVKKEIDKCEVLCANCHAIEHYKDVDCV